jgi:hypothetical protein
MSEALEGLPISKGSRGGVMNYNEMINEVEETFGCAKCKEWKALAGELWDYAGHEDGCDIFGMAGVCTCGFEKISFKAREAGL